jgi:NADH-quinone oxidoreductase subunit M
VTELTTIAVLLPLVTALVVGTLPRSEPGLARSFALLGALVELAVIVRLVWSFDPTGSAVQRAVAFPWLPAYGIAWSLGLDGRALALLAIIGLVFPLALRSGGRARAGEQPMIIGMLGLQAAWVAVILARDLVTLAAAWELATVVTVILLGGRTQAARRHAARVLPGAAALIGAVILLGVSHAHATGGTWSWDLDALTNLTLPPTIQYLGFALVLVAVATALPMVPIHGGLVPLCVSGPTPVVTVLLGAGMPMAVFLLARVAMPMFPLAAGEWADPIAMVAVLGAIYAALVCWAEREPGRLLAHVAILHLCLAIVGAVAGSPTAGVGLGAYLLAHGLGLVVLTTGFHALHRAGVDNLGELAGWAAVAPRGWTLTLLGALVLTGVPGTVGFVGELGTVVGILREGNVELLHPKLWGILGMAAVGLGTLGVLRSLWYAGHGVAHDRPALHELERGETWLCVIALVLALLLGVAPGGLLARSDKAERTGAERLHEGRCLAIEARNSTRPRLHEELREELGTVCLDPVAQIQLYYLGEAPSEGAPSEGAPSEGAPSEGAPP